MFAEQFITPNMSLATADTDIPEVSATSAWTEWPSENPTQDEAREWRDTWKALIRAKGYLLIAYDEPPRPKDMRQVQLLPAPAAGAANADAIAMRNQERVTDT